MPVPEQVTNVRQERETATTILVSWDRPDSVEHITDYQYRINGGQWTSTHTSATMILLTGLQPDTSYMIEVRAEAAGAATFGQASAPITVTTGMVGVPGVPRFVSVRPIRRTVAELTWAAPLDHGGGEILYYEVCVINEDGSIEPFERTDGPETVWRVRGLAYGHRYGFRVRARNSAGNGPPAATVETAMLLVPSRTIPDGTALPVLDTDRQSFIVRIANQDCRLRVWWQPSDSAWYGSLEVPTNTPIVQGRRLALNSGLLDRLTDVLPGNIVMRELGEAGEEPARDAWRRPTHALMWEPA